MHLRRCWFEFALTPNAHSVAAMSTRRKARNGYFYELSDFVSWYGDVRGTYLWEEAEEFAGAEEPSTSKQMHTIND